MGHDKFPRTSTLFFVILTSLFVYVYIYSSALTSTTNILYNVLTQLIIVMQ